MAVRMLSTAVGCDLGKTGWQAAVLSGIHYEWPWEDRLAGGRAVGHSWHDWSWEDRLAGGRDVGHSWHEWPWEDRLAGRAAVMAAAKPTASILNQPQHITTDPQPINTKEMLCCVGRVVRYVFCSRPQHNALLQATYCIDCENFLGIFWDKNIMKHKYKILCFLFYILCLSNVFLLCYVIHSNFVNQRIMDYSE